MVTNKFGAWVEIFGNKMLRLNTIEFMTSNNLSFSETGDLRLSAVRLGSWEKNWEDMLEMVRSLHNDVTIV